LTRLAFSFAFSLAVIAAASPGWADAGPQCASSKEAVEQARKAVATSDPADDRAALLCLAQTIAAFDAKLEGLRTGSVPFTGTAHTNVVILPKKQGKADR
jgi:hypothetical protein